LSYSGKKKRHTQKTQIIADKSGRKIIRTAFDKGRKHDFKLFKNSKVCFKEDVVCLADTGYQRIHKIHPDSELPKKRTVNSVLISWFFSV
jgi:urease accessory protein UreE